MSRPDVHRMSPPPVRVPAIAQGARRRVTRPSRLALLLALLGWFALAVAGVAEHRASPVGRAHAAYVDAQRPAWDDATRPRPLAATIWYPAVDGTVPRAWTAGVFEFGDNALDADPAVPATRRPLILVSHGTGGSAAQLSWLAEALAARGFIVAGVNHHGNTAVEDTVTVAGFTLWWERARDLSVLLDRLLADPRFAEHIDPQRIAVAGFSIGGFSALLTAGARVDLDAFQVHCRAHAGDDSCRPPPESPHSATDFQRFLTLDPVALASLRTAGSSFRDERIRAAFVLAPALMPALAEDSLRALDVPLQVLTGAADTLVQERFVQAASRLVPGADVKTLPGVGHYAFLAPCNAQGAQRLPVFCTDADGIDRRAVHRQAAARAIEFFTHHLCADRPPVVAGDAARIHPEADPCTTP